MNKGAETEYVQETTQVHRKSRSSSHRDRLQEKPLMTPEPFTSQSRMIVKYSVSFSVYFNCFEVKTVLCRSMSSLYQQRHYSLNISTSNHQQSAGLSFWGGQKARSLPITENLPWGTLHSLFTPYSATLQSRLFSPTLQTCVVKCVAGSSNVTRLNNHKALQLQTHGGRATEQTLR